jgi:DNA-binding NarL/FixJ family response regulator
VAEAWPFAAREDDLAVALKMLEEHGAVVLGGPAGVGKSRLSREIAARYEHGGVIGVVRATTSAQEIPLGAFVDVVPDLDSAQASPDLSDVREAVTALGSTDGDRLLLVDDAHLLDAASATVVHQLITGRRARVVLTVRTGEPAPDTVTALWKDDTAARIELEPFARDQTSAVLSSVLGGRVEARTARLLHDTTRGNVLWLRHLVDGESAAGRLRQEHGTWTWNTTGEVTLSPALGELLAGTIGTLQDDERRVVELLSVSEPLGLGMIERLAGASAVETVAQRGLISIDADGDRRDVRLGHPLYGESVRARTSVPRARRLRSELSAALGRTGGRRAGDALRRAVLDLGSDRSVDPDELVAASAQASGLQDFGLAERLLRAAIAAGGGFEARLGLAHLLDYLLRDREADAVLADAVAAASTADEREQAVVVRALHLHFQADPPGPGEDVLIEDEKQHGDGRRNPAYDAMRAMFLGVSGRVRESLELSDAVLADDTRPPAPVALAVFVAGLTRALTGRGDDLGTLIDRGIEAATRSPATAAVVCNVGYWELVDADLRGSPEIARRRLEWVRSLTGPQASVFVAIYEGRMAICAGLPRAAIDTLESVMPAFPGYGGGWSGWSLALIAQCLGMLGDAKAAREQLEEAERRRHPNIPVIDFEYDLARAWAAAAGGNTRGAVEHCRRGAERCRAQGLHAAEVRVRQTGVRLGDRDQLSRLTELDRLLGTPRSHLAAAHAAALTADDPERLLTVAARLEEAGMGLEAADAAGQSAAIARTHRRLVLAAEAEARAHALAGNSDDARTPALLGAHSPIALSAREREVALLAGEGLTNRAIAERLHVSVRTVESHVYRACARLGLNDRAELVAVAGVRSRS